ncbi:hypothetical protein K443DRAFT_680261 [Laccaria amethystina LaAM-08-1]|uniref:Uncharacterized protein n=1 Tax=Laccaria amethystina LaAM-08-1 TaxID=1095629 RepID=A0A0C9X227_9AGAR|nr:hypothetical protein K443DRAFT_680261 [Laccaria amethystina LaAM-08-1]
MISSLRDTLIVIPYAIFLIQAFITSFMSKTRYTHVIVLLHDDNEPNYHFTFRS